MLKPARTARRWKTCQHAGSVFCAAITRGDTLSFAARKQRALVARVREEVLDAHRLEGGAEQQLAVGGDRGDARGGAAARQLE